MAKDNKIVHCEVRWLDSHGGRIEKIRRSYLLPEVPVEISQNFLFAVSDRHSIFDIGGKPCEYRPGDILFLRPGQPVKFRTLKIPTQGTVYRGIEVSAGMARRILEQLNPGQSGYVALQNPILGDREFSAFISDLHDELLETPSQETELPLCKLFERLLQHRDATFEPTPHARSFRFGIRRAIDYMHDNYRQGIKLDELAKVADMSLSRFSHDFSRMVGTSPHYYLIQYRVQQAKSLLCFGMPCARVATETGFVDQAHFSRHFKRLTALTPGQYVAGTTKAVRT